MKTDCKLLAVSRFAFLWLLSIGRGFHLFTPHFFGLLLLFNAELEPVKEAHFNKRTHVKVKRSGIHRKSFKKRVSCVKSNGAKIIRSDFRFSAVGEMTDGLCVPRANGCLLSPYPKPKRLSLSSSILSLSQEKEKERTRRRPRSEKANHCGRWDPVTKKRTG